jgi:hypothetical protein
MNERIKELAEQAGFIGESMYPINGTCQQTALQNFAELIVRECANWIKNTDSDSDIGEEDARALLEHFGVEE